jgi:hypothetical protein
MWILVGPNSQTGRPGRKRGVTKKRVEHKDIMEISWVNLKLNGIEKTN